MEEQNKQNTFYAKLPDFTFAVRTSVKDVKFAVLARYCSADTCFWSKWHVARWSTSQELAEKHARYLRELCPAVKKHGSVFETEVVPVSKNLVNETSDSKVFTAELMCPKCKIGKLRRIVTDSDKFTKIACDTCDYWFELAIALFKPSEQEEEEE